MFMRFGEWIRNERGGHVFVFYETADDVAAAFADTLFEGGRTHRIDNRWSVRVDAPHAPNMQQHNHVLFRGDQVAVINRDGTQSHGTTIDEVPNWVVDQIRGMELIENNTLMEGNGDTPLRVPFEVITAAHSQARWADLLLTIGL